MTLDIQRTPVQYEAYLDGERVGKLIITRHGGVVTAHHTVVAPEAEGKGVGSALARALLDDARSAGRQVKVECPFIADWIERHPEYAEYEAH